MYKAKTKLKWIYFVLNYCGRTKLFKYWYEVLFILVSSKAQLISLSKQHKDWHLVVHAVLVITITLPLTFTIWSQIRWWEKLKVLYVTNGVQSPVVVSFYAAYFSITVHKTSVGYGRFQLERKRLKYRPRRIAFSQHRLETLRSAYRFTRMWTTMDWKLLHNHHGSKPFLTYESVT